jgi:hypothetical protein
MPLATFDVESYTVGVAQAGTSANGPWRRIVLVSTALAHGIRARANLYFIAGDFANLGVVANVDQPNYNGHSVYAYCKKADFAEWYDLLRYEAPLKFEYFYDGPDFDPSQPGRALRSYQLYTGLPEPPGEGPEEILANRFPALMRALFEDSTPGS